MFVSSFYNLLLAGHKHILSKTKVEFEGQSSLNMAMFLYQREYSQFGCQLALWLQGVNNRSLKKPTEMLDNTCQPMMQMFESKSISYDGQTLLSSNPTKQLTC